MTNDERQTFYDALAKLGVACRKSVDVPTLRIYFKALQDVPLDLMLAALTRAIKHAGAFLTSIEQLREFCDELQDEGVEEMRQLAIAPREGLLMLEGGTIQKPGPLCHRCDDSGTRHKCPGCDDFETCPTRQGYYCEAFKNGKYSVPVGPCECAPTNPNIMRKKALEAKVRNRYSRKYRAAERDDTQERY